MKGFLELHLIQNFNWFYLFIKYFSFVQYFYFLLIFMFNFVPLYHILTTFDKLLSHFLFLFNQKVTLIKFKIIAILNSLGINKSVVHGIVETAVNFRLCLALMVLFKMIFEYLGVVDRIKAFFRGRLSAFIKFNVVDGQLKRLLSFALILFVFWLRHVIILNNVGQAHHVSVSIHIFVNLHMLSFTYLFLLFCLFLWINFSRKFMWMWMIMLFIMIFFMFFMLTNVLFKFIFHFAQWGRIVNHSFIYKHLFQFFFNHYNIFFCRSCFHFLKYFSVIIQNSPRFSGSLWYEILLYLYCLFLLIQNRSCLHLQQNRCWSFSLLLRHATFITIFYFTFIWFHIAWVFQYVLINLWISFILTTCLIFYISFINELLKPLNFKAATSFTKAILYFEILSIIARSTFGAELPIYLQNGVLLF